MDIAKLSMDMSGARIMTEVSMKVLKMSLDQMQDVGQMLDALDADVPAPVSADPTVGQFLDITA